MFDQFWGNAICVVWNCIHVWCKLWRLLMCHAIRHGSSQDSIHPHRWRIFIEFHWNCFFAQARRVSPSAVGTKRKGKGRILFGNMMRMRLMSKTVSQRLVVLSVRGMAGRMGGYAPLPGKASSSDSWMRLLVGNAANLRKRCLSNPFASFSRMACENHHSQSIPYERFLCTVPADLCGCFNQSETQSVLWNGMLYG